MRNRYRKEPIRCVCTHGPDAHPQHCKPSLQAGKHLDPRCPHSELFNHTMKYPAMLDTLRRKGRFTHPMSRVIVS